MSANESRRDFVKTLVGTASIAATGLGALAVGPAHAAHTRVRRSVGAMDASDPILVSYAEAIKIMKSLPNADPRSWTYQAAIHGTLLTPAMTAWNSCAHGNYYFWSWHRMYLYWFERIIRKLACDECWALPYWNWSDPAQRHLPNPFRITSSELYTANRNAAINNGSGTLSASDTDYSGAFGFVDFDSASGSLEGTPHGIVHVRIGGWMGSVPTAAQDPIFYLHHCNIDRLWNLWLAQRGGRADPVTDATWTDRKFTFFDENANQVTMTGCEILRAAEQLQYVYEGEPAQVNQYCGRPIKPPKIIIDSILDMKLLLVLGAEPTRARLDPAQLSKLRDIVQQDQAPLYLELGDVSAKTQPGAIWEVFVGLPDKVEPSTESPYYVGNVVLFGGGVEDESHHGFQPARFIFPLNQTVRSLIAKSTDELSVTFVPSGLLVDGKKTKPALRATVQVGRLGITRRKP